MSFPPQVKRELLVNCLRLCCICLKHCSTRIEIAHIVDKSEGGPDTLDNGIPACFDCHHDIGHYRKKHPKGNKFTSKELRLLKSRVFRLVESGALHAIIVAARIHNQGNVQLQESDLKPPPLSNEAKALLKAIVNKECNVARGGMLTVLDDLNRSLLIDKLIQDADSPHIVAALLQLAKSDLISPALTKIIISRTARKVALFGRPLAVAQLFHDLTSKELMLLPLNIQEALYEHAIQLINEDSFTVVNELVPSLESHFANTPVKLHESMIRALLSQSRSSSYSGSPSARRTLETLPNSMINGALSALSRECIITYGDHMPVKKLAAHLHKTHHAPLSTIQMDYLAMTRKQFLDKYDPD